MNNQALDRRLPAVMQPEQPKRRFSPGKAPIVPPGSVTGRSLVLVIAIMGFLACLTAGAVYMINQSANDWLRDVSSEVTVQVKPEGTQEDTEKKSQEIVKFLTGQNGVRNVSLLTLDQSAELVEPWLGQISAVKELPLPRLITVQVERDPAPDLATLKTVLTNKFPSAALDDHRGWQQQIRRVTGSLALGGVAVIILMAAATVAIIVSAARSAIASNREIVEVLNFVGAEERFIARQFERHFLKLGIRAGIVGALAAGAVFMFLPILTEYLSGAATHAEIRRLVGTGRLDALGYASLLIVVFAIAMICLLTSRYGVRRILNAQNQ
ncbi:MULTISPECIES: ABC transporter permease [Rhodomicrobium]|uniref:cell division protein FtsX n=1 Tax=Rhodomicrobium TaxID=1068 RepID=UPI000F73B90F|nr:MULTISPECIES: ABC transporter permease [Rhodomicrobium]